MTDDRANADEGSDPTNDIKAQNPDGTTTGDMTGSTDNTGVAADDAHKTEKLAKAGRGDDVDTDEGQE